MQKIYYKRKFTQFLKEHNLYDENAMKYLYQNGIFFDYIEAVSYTHLTLPTT